MIGYRVSYIYDKQQPVLRFQEGVVNKFRCIMVQQIMLGKGGGGGGLEPI
jgi:hypothetical protein